VIGSYDNITKAYIITTRSCAEDTITSLQINKTLSQIQQFTQIWKAVHTNTFLDDRFTLELYSKNNDEMQNPVVNNTMRRLTFPSEVINTSQLNNSKKTYNKLVNGNNKFLLIFTRIINIVTHNLAFLSIIHCRTKQSRRRVVNRSIFCH